MEELRTRLQLLDAAADRGARLPASPPALTSRLTEGGLLETASGGGWGAPERGLSCRVRTLQLRCRCDLLEGHPLVLCSVYEETTLADICQHLAQNLSLSKIEHLQLLRADRFERVSSVAELPSSADRESGGESRGDSTISVHAAR